MTFKGIHIIQRLAIPFSRQNEENRKTQLSLADQISAVSLATRSTIRRKGMLWKFSYKHNNPMYERVSRKVELSSLKIDIF